MLGTRGHSFSSLPGPVLWASPGTAVVPVPCVPLSCRCPLLLADLPWATAHRASVQTTPWVLPQGPSKRLPAQKECGAVLPSSLCPTPLESWKFLSSASPLRHKPLLCTPLAPPPRLAHRRTFRKHLLATAFLTWSLVKAPGSPQHRPASVHHLSSPGWVTTVLPTHHPAPSQGLQGPVGPQTPATPQSSMPRTDCPLLQSTRAPFASGDLLVVQLPLKQ